MSRLIVVPTNVERELIAAAWREFGDCPISEMHLCGFGPIAAAARTSQLIATFRPSNVTLMGIAGALSDRVTVGNAYEFSSVFCDGIGVGCGHDFQSAAMLGWPQVDGAGDGPPRIQDHIDNLVSHDTCQLLTVCSGSSSVAQANERRERYAIADAEDMEGFGVAMSCKLANVPLRIVRGISNVAGNRDKASWQVETAIRAATTLMLS
jgi:futalosine hydrolase